MIPFNKPCNTGSEEQYVLEAMQGKQLCGDGGFTKKCHNWFNNYLKAPSSLLTTSCTHALEMTAIILDIKEGDEIIMPSFTFVSTANAFVLRGAKIVFVDIRPDTMNIDEKLIEDAITDKTVAIVPVHYAAVACEMDKIMEVANKYDLIVIEDAAQAMTASYKGRKLGTIGHFGAFSFHDTKNYTSGGEGGLLIINDEKYIGAAEIIREKGTNRSLFLQGLVDKYSWVSVGSSYLPNELSIAYLWGQLQNLDKINTHRMQSWNYYYDKFSPLVQKGFIELPHIPEFCEHNAHIFYIKLRDNNTRSQLINHLKTKGIAAVFHYVPLHSSVAGKKFGQLNGKDIYTTRESNQLLRLPLYYNIPRKHQNSVIEAVYEFLK
jgi:dTDP-4-amino-4,6-dideoxygalactose transaminase